MPDTVTLTIDKETYLSAATALELVLRELAPLSPLRAQYVTAADKLREAYHAAIERDFRAKWEPKWGNRAGVDDEMVPALLRSQI